MNRRPPRPPSSSLPPSPKKDDGAPATVRRTKKARGSGTRTRGRRIVDKVKTFLDRSSPDIRDVPPVFEGSIYGNDDESEN